MSVKDGLPVRRSARVLLVNQQQELLLLGANERLWGRTREIWVPAGGGVEPGESNAEAAARELLEETGLWVEPERLGSIVARRRGLFMLNGIQIWGDDVYFFHQIVSWDIDMSRLTELERQTVALHRWWSLDEMRSTDRVVFPLASELATLIAGIVESGPPTEPIELSWGKPHI